MHYAAVLTIEECRNLTGVIMFDNKALSDKLHPLNHNKDMPT